MVKHIMDLLIGSINAYDPSVNHLVIVEAQEGLTHTFPTTTYDEDHEYLVWKDQHRSFICYMLVPADTIDDEATLAIMDAFLNSIDLRPDWLSLSMQSGTIPAGESEILDVTFDANALDEGNYSAVYTGCE